MSVRSVTPWSRFTLALRLLVAVGLLPLSLVLSGCGSTAQPPTPGTAAETPGVEPTSEPSETQAPTETATPTETESPSPEANPFITERFKELDAMTLEEFEEQPREDRAAYMAAFMYKFSDPEWQYAVTDTDGTLQLNNPVLGVSSLENSGEEIAYQQFFKERAAGAVEFIDSDPDEYVREYSLRDGQKLAAAQFYFSPSEMDEQTKIVYDKQLERVEESFDDNASGVSGDITVSEKENDNQLKEIDGKEQTTRVVGMRIDDTDKKWATSFEFVYVKDVVDGKPVNQWTISKASMMPTNFIPIEK